MLTNGSLYFSLQTLFSATLLVVVSSKAVNDQTAEPSQRNEQVAEQRVGFDYGATGGAEAVVDDHHHHHEDHHDPGFWKKKVEWKEGWKKIWKPAKKLIQKPAWKKIWKPIWIPTTREEWVPTKGNENKTLCPNS